MNNSNPTRLTSCFPMLRVLRDASRRGLSGRMQDPMLISDSIPLGVGDRQRMAEPFPFRLALVCVVVL